MPVITLLTDFGTRDAYHAVLHGVIVRINPAATIVDLTHHVPPQDIAAGALILQDAYRYFPTGTIHVAVVDPGVGSDRRLVAVRSAAGVLVAPDNGLLSGVLAGEVVLEAVALQEPRYWLPRVSTTFHGRDILATVAAHISLGVPLSALGPPAGELCRRLPDQPQVDPAGRIHGRVLHVDGFGNLITDISEVALRGQQWHVLVAGQELVGPARTYADVAPGALVAVIGSSGRLEIAVRDGSAAVRLGVGRGASVVATPLARG